MMESSSQTKEEKKAGSKDTHLTIHCPSASEKTDGVGSFEAEKMAKNRRTNTLVNIK